VSEPVLPGWSAGGGPPGGERTRSPGRRRALRSHWVLLAVSLLVLAVLLTVNGVTQGQFGEGNGPSPAATSPALAGLRAGGPVVDAAHPDSPGLRVPDRTIAFTFDDGPGPDTGRILDVLARHHVPATFFLVGRNITQDPGLVRRMIADGHEIGVHTFTHADLTDVPGWRAALELSQTQLVLATETGRTSSLLRLPYSSVTGDMTSAQAAAVARAGGSYWAAFTDLDSKDWSRPGVDRIVRASTPAGNRGAVVMMHDGGGDRSETAAALEQLIPALRARGYRFTTVTDAVGLATPMHAASGSERVRGAVVVGAMAAARLLHLLLTIGMIVVAALSVLRLVFLLLIARRHHRRAAAPPDWLLPSVTVVIPAYNEAVGIAAAVRSLAASDYPDFDIVVVDDGSTDATAEVVLGLGLTNVRLLRQANGGKPAALNTGIAAARGEVLVLVDGDTVFEPATLRNLVRQLSDPGVGAVSGNTKVGNRGGLIGRWQHIEYVIGFNLDRRMFDVLQCMPTIPGAIGAFRRDVLTQVGGVSADTLAEDTDLTMAICRTGWRVVYEPQAVAWTEAPARLGQLWKQRYRWCYGTLQAMWKHRRAVIERGASGRLGRRGLPYLLVFQVLLPLLGPAVDVIAVYGLVFGSMGPILAVWLGFTVLQLLAALYAFRLDREDPRPLWALVTQQVVYRQLMYLVVIQSAVSAIAGIRLRWHTLQRTGDLGAAESALTSR
jgi:peptidoglycan/xylan/chitin deacetylase (PgdA/CDA1 family)/glycosyltransferase involved in cell wall biosynthesis